MVTKNNQEMFNEAVARILAHLWVSHPIPCQLTLGSFSKIFPDLTEDERKFYAHTAGWLAQEGLVCTNQYEIFGRPNTGPSTLTLQGMALLGQTLPSVDSAPGAPPTSLGQELLHAVRTGALGAAQTLVREGLVFYVKSHMGMS